MSNSAVSFAKSKREKNEERIGVGPGQYNSSSLLHKDRQPQYSFGHSRRDRKTKNEESPGPGSYNIPTKFNELAKYQLITSEKS